MNSRTRRNTLKSALCAAASAVALAAWPAEALVVNDPLSFLTADQGMWAPGQAQALGGTSTFTAFNQSFPNTTFGDIVLNQVPGTGGTVPNPGWGLWFICVNTVNVFCGDEPSTTLPNPIPAAFVKNGAELVLSNMHLDFGIRTTLQLAPGSVGSGVQGMATLTLPDGPLAAGQVFTLGSSGGASDASLATDFGLFNVGFTPFINLTGKAELEAWAAGLNVIPKSTLLNLNVHANTEFVGLAIGDGGIQLRTFGNSAFIPVSDGFGANIPVPGIVPPPLDTFVGFPMGDVQVYIPSLDTPPNTSFDPSTTTVTNSQDTTTRLGDTPLFSNANLGIGVNGPTAIDFAKLDVDLDVFSLLAGIPLGISGGIPLTATVELNALDLDFGTFAGIGQTLSLKPEEIMVDLLFSVPVEVETSPGVFEFKDEWSFRLGDILNIVHPGGDLDITPIYRLSDNLFSNLTQLFLSPGFSLDFLQLKFGGVLFSALGLGDFKVFGQFFPVTGAPAPVHTFANTSFALEDWTTDPGTTMRISAPAAADVVAAPEPATLALFVVGLAGLFAIRRRRSV